MPQHSRPRARPGGLPLAALLLLAAAAASAPAQVVYVKSGATGANNGTSWADAYAELRDAIAAASSGEVWVAAGTYRPAPPNGSQTLSFALKSGVALYGGFAGTESSRDQRRPTVHATILSGDLNGDDGANWTGMQDNSDHVVVAMQTDATAILDGFTIRGGYATNAPGAGMLVQDASPTVRGCMLGTSVANWSRGAGISVWGTSAPVFTACAIEGNYAYLGRGGGLSVGSGASATLADCRFADNRATGSSSDGNGGAIYLDVGSTLSATGCTFVRNVAELIFGGFFYPGSGGAIASLADTMTLTRCAFIANRSDAGGAIYAYRGANTITSCLFDGNRAVKQAPSGGFGGALASTYTSATTLDGCTLVGNSATEDAGGIWADSTAGSCHLASSVLWNNSDGWGQVGESQLKGTRQHHCCVMNMLVARKGEDPVDPTKFPQCTDRDPQFVDADGADNVRGTEDDDLRLLATSPCVDTGDPATLDAGLDLAGALRVLDGNLDAVLRVDMGAHELSHVRLAVTASPLGGGAWRLRSDLGGTPSMPVLLAIGAPAPALLLPPFGAIYFAPGAFVVLPAGTIPKSLTLDLPPLPLDLVLQGLAIGSKSAQLSNPVSQTLR